MKKLLGLTLSLASIGFVVTSAEAKAASTSVAPNATALESSATPQWRRDRYNRRVRVVTRTRLVRVGRRVYRETIQIRYLPNGRTTTRVVSRVRVR
jgi:hypothetical protein